MTDNEIIKYLEQAIDKYNKNEIFVDNIRLDKLSLDLINRQKAEYNNLLEQFRILDCECERLEKTDENQKIEIDGLRADLKRVCAERDAHICTNNFIKSEAIKEFAERLKARIIEDFLKYNTDTTIGYIDNLVKEMEGDTE